MNWLPTILREPMLERLGWTLVHSVWECAAVALVLALLLLILRRSETRYLAGCAALIACIAVPIVTFVMLAQSPVVATPSVNNIPVSALQADVLILSGVSVPAITEPIAPPVPAPARDRSFQRFVPLAGVIWLAGVVLLCARHFMGWMSLRRMRHTARPITDGEMLTRLRQLMERLGIRGAIALAESGSVHVPSMIGWLRPMILLPVGALNNLSLLHIEAILAHELAHIHRHDYLANLVQTLIETLLFYHPGVWWISKMIRQEREHCCDDLAVRIVGNAREYGAALAAMEELRSPATLMMAASGGSLLKRIRRLVKPEPRRGMIWPAIMIVAVMLGVAACNKAMQPGAQEQAQKPPAPATQPAAEPPFNPEPYLNVTAAELMQLSPAQRRAVMAEKARRTPRATPATTRSALSPRDQELKELSRARITASLRRIEAEAAFGAGHPKIAQLRREEAEAVDLYMKAWNSSRATGTWSVVAQWSPATQPDFSGANWIANPSGPSTQPWNTDRSAATFELQNLSAALTDAELKYIQLKATLGPDHPDLQQAKRVVAALVKSHNDQLQRVRLLNEIDDQQHAALQSDREMLMDQSQQLLARLTQLNRDLARMKSQLGPDHATIAAAEREINAVEYQIQLMHDEMQKAAIDFPIAQNSPNPAIAMADENPQMVKPTSQPATESQIRIDASTPRIPTEVLTANLEHLNRQLEALRKQKEDMARIADNPSRLLALNVRIDGVERQYSEIMKVLAARRESAPAPTYYISGVPNSGMYPIPDGQSISLVDVINRAGRIQDLDTEKFIVIVHQQPVNGQKSLYIRVQDAINRPASESMRVIPGDVIMVTTQGALPLAPEARYTIEGRVSKPGRYPLQKNMTLLQALVAAGVNPPEAPGWDLEWRRSAKAGPGRANTIQTVRVADLIDGAVGMEAISAGDTIKVMAPNEALPEAAPAQ